MEPIVWTQHFSVGVAELDRQHKKIIKIINELITEKSTHNSDETISEILTRMRLYGEEHFRSEEEYMQKYQYPESELVPHQKMHKVFKIKVAKYCNAILEQQENVSDGIFEFLVSWWVKHILEIDMKYKRVMSSELS